MTNSQVLECCDCLNHFCSTCDFGHTYCPDCKQSLCEACSSDADARMSRCASCHDPDTATTLFPYASDERLLHKHYSAPQRGRLNE